MMMMQLYLPRQYADQYKITQDKLIGGIMAVVNAVLGLFVGYVLVARLISLIENNKMVTLDYVIIIGGLILVVVKVAVAIISALIALASITIGISDDILKGLGTAAVIINMVFFILYVVLMFLLGTKDPTFTVYMLFMIASLVLFGELLSSGAYVYFIYMKTSTSQIAQFPYTPVMQFQ